MDLARASWRLARILRDRGNEFVATASQTSSQSSARPGPISAPAGPETSGHGERLHKTILDECWRPAFARYLYPRLSGLRRELDTYLAFYNNDRVHHGRLTQGQIPADIVYGAPKMEIR